MIVVLLNCWVLGLRHDRSFAFRLSPDLCFPKSPTIIRFSRGGRGVYRRGGWRSPSLRTRIGLRAVHRPFSNKVCPPGGGECSLCFRLVDFYLFVLVVVGYCCYFCYCFCLCS